MIALNRLEQLEQDARGGDLKAMRTVINAFRAYRRAADKFTSEADCGSLYAEPGLVPFIARIEEIQNEPESIEVPT